MMFNDLPSFLSALQDTMTPRVLQHDCGTFHGQRISHTGQVLDINALQAYSKTELGVGNDGVRSHSHFAVMRQDVPKEEEWDAGQ